ncbi:MAG: hypothetical protein MUF66_12230, partial [Gammaproteobacteria bacterium]|nr:hypothetical protein [Gammaproteobacteria bacterium]
IARLVAAGHPLREVAGYTLDQVQGLARGLAAEERRRDRERLLLLRAAQADAAGWRSIWRALTED